MTERVIAALGCNQGCRLTAIRTAIQHIANVPGIIVQQVSSLYRSTALLPEGAPMTWDEDYFNLAISCQTTLTPTAFLQAMKQIEVIMGRGDHARWSPRIIDIDLIAWGNEIIVLDQLTIPHRDCLKRNFVLLPLLEIAPDWRHPQQPTLDLRALTVELQQQERTERHPLRLKPPYLVGVVNVTPDSFSDGGSFFDPEKAIAQCHTLLQAGAEIIDLGAESTRPYQGAQVTSAVEWQRLKPVLEGLTADLRIQPYLHHAKICIDTRHIATMEQAMAYPIAWINDQEGRDLPAIANLLRGTGLRYVRMHNLGLPPRNDVIIQGDVIAALQTYAQQAIDTLTSHGLERDQIIFDSGIGFGKSPAQIRELLLRHEELKTLGVDLLLGHSRKSFMLAFQSAAARDRDLETAALATVCRDNTTYLRIHDVTLTARALQAIDWLREHTWTMTHN